MSKDQYKKFECYSVLGIAPSATPAEIKAAYRKMSLKTHPDVGGSHDAQARVNLAHEVLSDPVQRRTHDIFWKVRTQTAGSNTQQSSTPRPEASTSQRQESRTSTDAKSAPLTGFFRRMERAAETHKAQIWALLEARIKEQEAKIFEDLRRTRRRFWAFAAASSALSAAIVAFPKIWPLAVGVAALTAFQPRKLALEDADISIFGESGDRIKEAAS